MDQLAQRMRTEPGVAQVSPTIVSPNGKAALLQVVPTGSPQDESTTKLIHRLRGQVVPSSTAGTALDVHIGGQTAIFADLAAKHKLPAIYPYPDLVDAGGLVTYGVAIDDLFRRSATYVDRILKGARAGDLPVEQPTTFELVVNLKAANRIGLVVPPAVLARADRVLR